MARTNTPRRTPEAPAGTGAALPPPGRPGRPQPGSPALGSLFPPRPAPSPQTHRLRCGTGAGPPAAPRAAPTARRPSPRPPPPSPSPSPSPLRRVSPRRRRAGRPAPARPAPAGHRPASRPRGLGVGRGRGRGRGSTAARCPALQGFGPVPQAPARAARQVAKVPGLGPGRVPWCNRCCLGEEELVFPLPAEGQLLSAVGLDLSPGRCFRAVLARSEERLLSSQPPLPAEPHTEKVGASPLPGGSRSRTPCCRLGRAWCAESTLPSRFHGGKEGTETKPSHNEKRKKTPVKPMRNTSQLI